MKYLLTIIAALIFSAAAVADPFYVGGYGGLNLGSDFSDDGSNADLTFNSSPEAGVVVGGYIGAPLQILPGFSAELDVNWRSNQTGGTRTLNDNTTDLIGNDSLFAALANARYTQALTPVLNVYGLAGVGYGSRRITFEPVPTNFFKNGMGADRSGFVWQVGAGVEYAISPSWSMGLGYRFLAGPEIGRIIEWEGESSFYEASADNHSFLFTTTYTIN